MFLTALMAAAQEEQAVSTAGAGIGIVMSLVWLAVVVVVIASVWKVFTKAGEPGWAAIVPIYNIIVMLKIAGKPLWWILLLLIPFVNIIIGILVLIALAKNFGKGAGFGVGLAVLGIIFFPILGFGDAKFNPQP
ncbi:MAG: DUF5684 domain-containing protein [Acidobacteria bacterium]|nr:DUF5684 domain-containing protein [Acidobacteriota bacterium]